MTPKFQINNTDYAPYIQQLDIQINDLDADGSGRNILDGKMYRSRIASKFKLSVKMLPVSEQMIYEVSTAVSGTYTEVTFLNPKNNTEETKEFYCSSFNFGNQYYSPSEELSYYDGASFDLTER